MDATTLVNRVLDDEGLVSGLDEKDASVLIRSLVARVEEIARQAMDVPLARRRVDELCRHARQVAEIVATYRAVGELTARATAARYGLTLPTPISDPAVLLRTLLGEWKKQDI